MRAFVASKGVPYPQAIDGQQTLRQGLRHPRLPDHAGDRARRRAARALHRQHRRRDPDRPGRRRARRARRGGRERGAAARSTRCSTPRSFRSPATLAAVRASTKSLLKAIDDAGNVDGPSDYLQRAGRRRTRCATPRRRRSRRSPRPTPTACCWPACRASPRSRASRTTTRVAAYAARARARAQRSRPARRHRDRVPRPARLRPRGRLRGAARQAAAQRRQLRRPGRARRPGRPLRRRRGGLRAGDRPGARGGAGQARRRQGDPQAGLGVSLRRAAVHPARAASRRRKRRVRADHRLDAEAAQDRQPLRDVPRGGARRRRSRSTPGTPARAPRSRSRPGPGPTCRARSPAPTSTGWSSPARRARRVALAASGLPKRWIASFCSDRQCAPFRTTVAIPESGVKVVEFQLVPQSKLAAPGDDPRRRRRRASQRDGRRGRRRARSAHGATRRRNCPVAGRIPA